MVVGIALRVGSRIAKEVAGYYKSSGASLIPRGYREVSKFDKRLHSQVFGRSAGRGVRHGRDIGLASSQFLGSGDDLEVGSRFQPQYSSRKFDEAHRGYRYGRGSRRPRKYRSRCNCRRFSRFK